MKVTVWHGKKLVMREIPFALQRRIDRPWWHPIGETVTAGLALAAWVVIIVLAVVGSSGCASAPNWCDTHRCEYARTFAPGPGLETELTSALERWSTATGFELSIDPDGIPVGFADHTMVWPDTGTEACAITAAAIHGDDLWTRAVELSDPMPSGCPDVETQLLHELAHALAPHAKHGSRGLFSRNVDGSTIDEAALMAVCAEAECPAFVPEEP